MKYKNVIKTSKNFMVFIQEIVYLWGVYNKSWRVWVNRNSLDSFVCKCWKSNIFWYFWSWKCSNWEFFGNKNIITNIYRIQAYDSIIYGYFCMGLADFMLKSKSFKHYANFFSSNEYKKNDKIIIKLNNNKDYDEKAILYYLWQD